MTLPLVFDGMLQLKTSYESTNIKRLITGILFGYACLRLVIWSYAATFRFGMEMGAKLSKTG